MVREVNLPLFLGVQGKRERPWTNTPEGEADPWKRSVNVRWSEADQPIEDGLWDGESV